VSARLVSVLTLTLSAMSVATAEARPEKSHQNDAVGVDVATRLRACADLFAAGAPSRARLLEALGATKEQVSKGIGRDFDAPAFSAEIETAGTAPSRVVALTVYPRLETLVPWRLVKVLAPRWRTIASGESTMVQASVPGADGGAPVVAFVRLFLSPKNLEGRVLSVSFQRD
jgi:hypothetical protein